MRIDVLHRTQRLDGTPEQVFPFFADAANLDAITPPLLRFSTLTPGPIAMRTGTVIQYALRLHGVPLRWTSVIQAWEPPHRFIDVQLRGPFGLWHHEHRFAPTDDGGTLMTDHVHHGVGWGPAGALARRLFVLGDVGRIFDHRARVIPGLLAADVRARDRAGDGGRHPSDRPEDGSARKAGGSTAAPADDVAGPAASR
jgi:ligand-binding SRPBCC domain-containing protein